MWSKWQFVLVNTPSPPSLQWCRTAAPDKIWEPLFKLLSLVIVTLRKLVQLYNLSSSSVKFSQVLPIWLKAWNEGQHPSKEIDTFIELKKEQSEALEIQDSTFLVRIALWDSSKLQKWVSGSRILLTPSEQSIWRDVDQWEGSTLVCR